MKLNCKRISAIITAIFILSLIPLYALGFYNHPSIDDYYYGIKTYHAVKNGENVIFAAGEQVAETYFEWQGTYSAIFLFSLQPAIFGEHFYAVSTLILLTLFIAANLIFSYVFLHIILKMRGTAVYIIAVAVTFMSIQFVPSPCQSYYWWNGSIYYTFFYSLSLMFFSVLPVFFNSKKMHTKILSFSLAFILSIVLGGGNYVTALATGIIILSFCVYLAVKQNKYFFSVIVLAFIFFAGFFISITAPGNSVRAAGHEYTSAFTAIIYSFGYSVYYITQWTDITFVIIIVFIAPFVCRASARSSFSFKYPFLFILFEFCLFTAQFTPPIYGMGGFESGRIFNIIYYSYIWFVIFAVYYVSGYIAKKHGFSIKEPTHKISKYAVIILVIALIVPLIGSVDELRDWKGGDYSSAKAVYSLYSGEAETYDKENYDRYEALTDNTVSSVVFKPFSRTPELLFYGDLTQDPEYMWSNKPMREYFGKESVTVDWSEK